MVVDSSAVRARVTKSEWYLDLAAFERPHLGKAIGQILSSFLPYLAIWALMVWMFYAGCPYWLIFMVQVVAAAFLVRIFILFHDCVHHSFFASRQANRILGYLIGVLTYMPYESWQHSHNVHHNTYADLDFRGVGDVKTMTVDEYLAAPWGKRLTYWLYRNPLVLFGLGPAFLFLISERFPIHGSGKRESRSVHVINLAIFSIIAITAWCGVAHVYLLLQLPIAVIAGTFGVWLFYVQHQFEGVYWSRHEQWDPLRAALEGSSYYKLPNVLQWFSGNIGIHHVHHVRQRIPNYNLQACLDASPVLQAVKPLSLRGSLKSLTLNLWDEKEQRMVSFRSVRRRRLT